MEGVLSKRRKGVFGPPLGQNLIIFVDDLSLPEVEEYGAQPPIELLRQFLGYQGWYDLKEKSWKEVLDTTVVATMGPPGGGRNAITPRLARFFHLLCFSDFNDASLLRIFSTIVDWHLTSYAFSGDIKTLTKPIVDATLGIYRQSVANLLPTPQKSHYTFNLRDFSRVIQGMLLVKPYEGLNKEGIMKNWCHEVLRVFQDRLMIDEDREWFNEALGSIFDNHFGVFMYTLFDALDEERKGYVSWNDLRKLFFGSYLSESGDGPYREIQDLNHL
jgi:dynein heavy chain